MALSTVNDISNPPGLTLSAANSGSIVTTQWAGQPIVPSNLPNGFTCTIVNYSLYPYTSNTLSTALYMESGSNYNNPATTFTLNPGQSCILNVANCNGVLRYCLMKG